MDTEKPKDAVEALDVSNGSAPQYPMREWINRIRTEFNDGTFFEGNEVQHALVVSFTAQYHGGVKKTEVLEREMVVDWEEYDRRQSASPNAGDVARPAAEQKENHE